MVKEELVLQWLCDRRGISVQQLAEASGLTRPTVAHIVEGAIPSTEVADKILWGLNQLLPYRVRSVEFWDETEPAAHLTMARLKGELGRAGMSTIRLGDRIGCHHSTVVRLLNGHHRPTLALGDAFCAAVSHVLGVPIQADRLWAGGLRESRRWCEKLEADQG